MYSHRSFLFTHLFTLFFLPAIQCFLLKSFSWKSPVSNFLEEFCCRGVLLFLFFWNCFHLPSFWSDIFTGYRVLVGCYFLWSLESGLSIILLRPTFSQFLPYFSRLSPGILARFFTASVVFHCYFKNDLFILTEFSGYFLKHFCSWTKNPE